MATRDTIVGRLETMIECLPNPLYPSDKEAGWTEEAQPGSTARLTQLAQSLSWHIRRLGSLVGILIFLR